MTNAVRVTMLGPRGVGKTSLLAVMRHCLGAVMADNPLRLETTDDNADGRLRQRLDDLKDLTNSERDRRPPALGGTAELISYPFRLDAVGDADKLNTPLDIEFHDVPGGHLTDGGARSRALRDGVTASPVVLIPVDAPALLEEPGTGDDGRRKGYGRLHERFNRAEEVTTLLTDALKAAEGPRLVLFCPIRSERYLQKPDGDPHSRKIADAVEAGYRTLIDTLRNRAGTAVAVIPVQTVGGVQFSTIKGRRDGGDPTFAYKKFRYNAEFEPEHGDQVLRYVLRFLAAVHADRGTWVTKFLREWTGWDGPLKKGVAKLADGCRSDDPFRIIAGGGYL